MSTAQQTALNLKANLASPTFSGTVTLPSITSTVATYDQPNFFNPVSGDTNWAYGISNVSSDYWMQVKYADATRNGLRGFRVYSTAGPLVAWDVTLGRDRLYYDASNYVSTTVSSTGGVTLDAVGSGAGFTFNDRIINTLPLRNKGYTVAGLPAGTQGDQAFVTDALGPTYNATVVGGGAVVIPVFYNGTNWTCH